MISHTCRCGNMSPESENVMVTWSQVTIRNMPRVDYKCHHHQPKSKEAKEKSQKKIKRKASHNPYKNQFAFPFLFLMSIMICVIIQSL